MNKYSYLKNVHLSNSAIRIGYNRQFFTELFSCREIQSELKVAEGRKDAEKRKFTTETQRTQSFGIGSDFEFPEPPCPLCLCGKFPLLRVLLPLPLRVLGLVAFILLRCGRFCSLNLGEQIRAIESTLFPSPLSKLWITKVTTEILT